MKVLTRSGVCETMEFDKISERIAHFSSDLGTIDPIDITREVVHRIYDGIETRDLDELSVDICLQKSLIHQDYSTLANRIAIDSHHKDTNSSFSQVVKELYSNRDTNGDISPLVSDELFELVSNNSENYDNLVCHERDFLLDCFGFKTLQRSYLLKVGDKVIERPQYMFLRVSIGIHGSDWKGTVETYNLMSQKYFIHATPTLFNSGTRFPQLSSCFLLGMEDSVKGMYKCLSDSAIISKYAGGIGIHAHEVRSKGAYIRSTGGTTAGLVPLLRTFNSTCRHINQGGKRNGSFAIYIEPHHPDIFEFLDAKKPHGNEEARARDLFYGLWISDLFMERVKSQETWSLFDSDRCPGLSDCYGKEYVELYNRYESEGKYSKQVPARDVWKAILHSQGETGGPYMLYKDSVNHKTNQKNIGVIKSSNLCCEILEYSDSKEYAVCNLASISLPMFVETQVFDYKKLREVVSVMTRNLNKVIDRTFYPLPETKVSNLRHRPIGLGVQGLADVFVKMGLTFESQEAQDLNTRIFENIYYAAVKTSVEIAEELGPYETFKGSPTSEGKFQFDLWGVSPVCDDLDWESLRTRMITFGLRNSLLVAPMPTASTSQILGYNECIEPFTSNLYLRRTLAGEFIVINKHLVSMLTDMGIWSQDIKDKLMFFKGSVQHISEIPQHIKDLFKTAWEIKQKTIIDLAVSRGPYVCQSQSMNVFFENPTSNQLSSMHFYGWKKGLKTGSYYVRSKPASASQNFTLAPQTEERLRKELKDQEKGECLTCSA